MFLKKWIPSYARKPLWMVLIYDFIVYIGAGKIAVNGNLHDLTMPIDGKIPFIPAFVVIYLICYGQWVIGYILSCRRDEKTAWQFCVGEMFGKTICLLFYVFLPCTMVRAEIVSTDIFSKIVAFVYSVDRPVNLFPSIHCFASWISYRGISDKEYVSKKLKIFFFVFSILVFISTLTIKQHVFLDVISGIALAEISLAFGKSKIVDRFLNE